MWSWFRWVPGAEHDASPWSQGWASGRSSQPFLGRPPPLPARPRPSPTPSPHRANPGALRRPLAGLLLLVSSERRPLPARAPGAGHLAAGYVKGVRFSLSRTPCGPTRAARTPSRGAGGVGFPGSRLKPGGAVRVGPPAAVGVGRARGAAVLGASRTAGAGTRRWSSSSFARLPPATPRRNSPRGKGLSGELQSGPIALGGPAGV